MFHTLFDLIDKRRMYRFYRVKQINKRSISEQDKAPLEYLITSEQLIVEQKSQLLHVA